MTTDLGDVCSEKDCLHRGMVFMDFYLNEIHFVFIKTEVGFDLLLRYKMTTGLADLCMEKAYLSEGMVFTHFIIINSLMDTSY